MELGIQIAQYITFVFVLIRMISSNAKLLRQTREDIRKTFAKRQNEFAVHGLKKAFLRILTLTIAIAITVQYADFKVFWGILLGMFLVGYLATGWMMTKQLPVASLEISKERVDREVSIKWWKLAFNSIFFFLWLYSWRHLYEHLLGY